MSAWIMRAKDYHKWYADTIFHFRFQMTIIKLPLFDTNPIAITYWMVEENDLILVVDDSYIHPTPYTLEQIEEINKTWNKFYENES